MSSKFASVNVVIESTDNKKGMPVIRIYDPACSTYIQVSAATAPALLAVLESEADMATLREYVKDLAKLAPYAEKHKDNARTPAPAPAPVVKAPAPAPVVKAPAPAPVVKAPAPAPVVKAPAPAPVVKAPAPAPINIDKMDFDALTQLARTLKIKSVHLFRHEDKLRDKIREVMGMASAPAPVVKAPAPAPVVKAPAPAPVVKAPAPVRTLRYDFVTVMPDGVEIYTCVYTDGTASVEIAEVTVRNVA